jgi:hypothetical protein
MRRRFQSARRSSVNSSDPGPQNDDDHCCDSHLKFSTAKLDVYQHERLAYTEPPQKRSAARPKSRRATALLKAMAAWALAHF